MSHIEKSVQKTYNECSGDYPPPCCGLLTEWFFHGPPHRHPRGRDFCCYADRVSERSRKSYKRSAYRKNYHAGNLPISGAIVTAFNESGTRRTTAYSYPDGTYALPVAYSGDLSVRVRTPYFSDAVQNVTAFDGKTTVVDFVTAPMTDKGKLSNALIEEWSRAIVCPSSMMPMSDEMVGFTCAS